jgi:hypothetical protein
MNRNILTLIIGGFIIFLLISFKFYLNEKQKFSDEITHSIKIRQLVKKIKSIKFEKDLNYFKNYNCKIKDDETIKIECNVSKNKFASFQNVFKMNYKFKSFEIIKNNKNILVNLEIDK